MECILVRHGQAGRKSEWRGDDALRPLDANGRRQAIELVAVLAQYRFPRILSSPYLRCSQTVGPLSATTAQQVELTDALAPGAGDQALGLIRQLSIAGPPSVVLSTHGEVLSDVLPTLSSEFHVRLRRPLPGAKGSLWLLQFSRRRLTSMTYRAPKASIQSSTGKCEPE